MARNQGSKTQGGRGRGSRRSNNSRSGQGNSTKSTSTKKECKFAPQGCGGKSNYATYATTKVMIENHIQKHFDRGMDCAQSIRNMKLKDLESEKPVLKASTDADATARALENRSLAILHQEENKEYLRKKSTLTYNMAKAYQLIFDDYCTRTMQQRIEEHPDFEDNIRDNPILLLETIKTLVHDPVRAQYPWVSLTDNLTRLLNARQYDDENLLDYVKRMKQLLDVTKSQLGTQIFDGFIAQLANVEDDADEIKEAQTSAFESWSAYLTLRGADQSKYDSLTSTFATQFSLGNNQCPTTIVGATDALSNHKFDPKFAENKKKQREQQQRRQQNSTDETPVSSFAQRTTYCYCCGDPNHLSHDCPEKNKRPKSEWFVNQAMSNAQVNRTTQGGNQTNDEQDDSATVQTDVSTASTNNRRSETTQNTNTNTGWSGFQADDEWCGFVAEQTGKFNYLKDVILLDNGSTMKATFCNPDMVTNIRPSEAPARMFTNAGHKQMAIEADVPGMPGSGWLDVSQMANIFGFSHAADNWRITYDNSKEDAFYVYTNGPNGEPTKFRRTPEGLYAYKPTAKFLKTVAEIKAKETNTAYPEATELDGLIETVDENKKHYTQRQFDRAKRARKLQQMLGCTTDTLKHVLRQNIIKNCPVTSEDVGIAEKIFGRDIGLLKGKSTRRRPNQAVDDYVEIPPEIKELHHNLTFCMDLMHVNGLIQLTGKGRNSPSQWTHLRRCPASL